MTIRGLILGALITTIFTAANVYLGLKVGLTFASSIPAAVISMAILSAVKDSSILENNIVQTVASAAGTLSAIIFVLPGLVIVGWWTGFPFWQSFLICLSGGVLGVLFTIPLRRALVTNSDLPYPEGVAAAEVLKVGSGTRGETKDETGEAREGLVAVILGSVASAGLAIVTATRIAAGEVTGFFRLGATASSGYDIAWSLALLGAGHLVGLSVGMAMLIGLVIAWVDRRADPDVDAARCRRASTLAAHTTRDLAHAGAVHRRRRDRASPRSTRWRELAKPVVGGLVSTLAASRARATGDDLDRDLSPPWIYALTAALPRHRRRGSRFTLRAVDGARAERGDAHADRRAVRADRRLPHRRHLRLHGGPHRRVEQPDLRRRHSVDRALRVGARRSPWRRRRRRARRSSRSRCSSRRSSSPARRSRTTTCRI